MPFGYEGLTGDNATWFAAIASIFVGVVAIFQESIINHFFGPTLNLFFGDKPDYAKDGDYGKMLGCATSGLVDARIIRVKVVNTGKNQP